ncbi:MAG TPA: enoyl-CoA hydratase-related protein [Nitrososphaerales archaeon]|nr:enoyl-CoA hydratase-related protein [Nitrososphaerales archaeon]
MSSPAKYSNILVEKSNFVGIVRLNRPNVRNALSSALMKELNSALEGFESDNDVRCIIITGNEKAFSGGADIKDMSELNSVQALKEANLERFDVVGNISKPIIAAISGFALGGGLELAMACDIIVAAEDARLGQPEINIGVMPGAGGTQRLTRTVGKYKAMEMILTGGQISAKEAHSMGLVSRVVPNENYFSEAMKLAEEIASKPPLAVKLAKESILKSYESTLSEGLAFEHRNFYLLMSSEDKAEGMRAFIEKRKAQYKGK